MIYIIGLGLNEEGISLEGINAVKKCKKIYLESYTIEFPYPSKNLEKVINKKIIPVDRDFVESLEILDEAKKQDIALLVYGSPLTATTHTTLILETKKRKIKVKIIHNASVMDAVAETGLHLYKFGKIASIPKHEADSFVEIVESNLKINAHSLILVDIGLELNETLNKLIKALSKYKLKTDKIILCSRIGTKKSQIIYSKIENFRDKKTKKPFCIIIPGKLHFTEEDFLKNLKALKIINKLSE